MIEPFNDEYFMRKALEEAQLAFEEDEIPVGAVVVSQGKIIGRGHNMTERLNDVTAHAEMLKQLQDMTNIHLIKRKTHNCDVKITQE